MTIVYFDGLCNVCNRFIDFLIRRDRRRVMKYAPLQGSTARSHLPAHLVTDLSTMAFEAGDGRIYTDSSAAIRAIAALGGVWTTMYACLVVPRFVRDGVYRWVANHRYLFAGRRETCRLPTPAEREQFLD
jgi:predicted DCC family thiol-disulfide oxidoreductase YuxK